MNKTELQLRIVIDYDGFFLVPVCQNQVRKSNETSGLEVYCSAPQRPLKELPQPTVAEHQQG